MSTNRAAAAADLLLLFVCVYARRRREHAEESMKPVCILVSARGSDYSFNPLFL